jgi:hypothetical protein
MCSAQSLEFSYYVNDMQFVEENDDKFEYEQNDSPPILKGRLERHLAFWESINTNTFALEVIKHGYRLPLIDTPVHVNLVNNKSAYDPL